MTFPFPSLASAVAAAAGITYSYEGATNDNTNTGTYTFTSAAIGAADAARLIVLGVTTSATTARTVTSVTAGGNAMTKGPEAVNTGTNTSTIMYLPIAAGTTSTFVVTLSGTAFNCTIVVYRVLVVSGTPIDSVTGTGAPGTITDLEVKTTGLALFIGSATANITSLSWNGLDTPTRDLTNLTNDSVRPTSAWSIPTSENNSTRDATFTAGTSYAMAGISFQ